MNLREGGSVLYEKVIIDCVGVYIPTGFAGMQQQGENSVN